MHPKDDEGDLLEAGIIGRQIEEFAATPVGMYLDQCADAETDQGLAALMEADAHDAPAIAAAQNRVKLGQLFKSWMREAIAAGIRSTQVLESREHGDEP